MAEEPGKVFSLGVDLTPIAPRTTAEEFFQDESVHIRNFSQGRTQESGAQAIDADQLVIVVSGILCLKGMESGRGLEIISERGTNIGAGYVVYIPAHQSADFSTINGCVYTRIEFPEGTHVSDKLAPGKPVFLEKIAGTPGQASNVLEGDRVSLNVCKLARRQQTDSLVAQGKTLLYALSGKGVISYNGEDHLIKGGRNFIFNPGDAYSIASKGKFAFAVLSAGSVSQA